MFVFKYCLKTCICFLAVDMWPQIIAARCIVCKRNSTFLFILCRVFFAWIDEMGIEIVRVFPCPQLVLSLRCNAEKITTSVSDGRGADSLVLVQANHCACRGGGRTRHGERSTARGVCKFIILLIYAKRFSLLIFATIFIFKELLPIKYWKFSVEFHICFILAIIK